LVWPTQWMIRRLVHDHERVTEQRVRHGYVKLECWTSIAGNCLLGTAKLILGLLTGSIALTADAAHTYGDMVSSVILLVSMRVAAAPPDKRHPHGHGRAEALGTLALAAMLLLTAMEFAHPAFDRMVGWHQEQHGAAAESMRLFGWAIIPVLITFWAAKEWMARFSADLGRRISSDALLGDAQHHRSDALATLLVMFSFIGTRLGYVWLDGLFGLGVAGFIGWAGLNLAWRMMSQLLGEAPSEESMAAIISAAASARGVRGVHGVEVHDYGNHKAVSLHIEVPAAMSTADSHAIATTVEEAILRRLGMHAVVHVELPDGQAPANQPGIVEVVLQETVITEKSVRGFHAVQVTSSDRQLTIDLHLIVEHGLPVEECHRIEHELAAKLVTRLGAAKVSVHCEPPH
jgi:cation diffusion facilitator family transporter